MTDNKIRFDKSASALKYRLWNSGTDGKIDMTLPFDTNPAALNAMIEIMRSMKNLKADNASFEMELLTVGKTGIPAINLVPYAAEGTGRKFPLVIFLHGFETSKEKVIRYGIHFASAGYYTVLVDLPDHGERMTKDFYEKYGHDESDIRLLANRIYLMERSLEELKIVADHYSSLDSVDAGRIGMAGISMGGTLSMLYSYNDRRIRAITPYLSILGYGGVTGSGEVKGFFSDENLETINGMDPLNVFREYRGTAVLAQFGANDPITERPALYEFSKLMDSLYASNTERFRMIRHAGIGHEVSMEMIGYSMEWFDKFL